MSVFTSSLIPCDDFVFTDCQPCLESLCAWTLNLSGQFVMKMLSRIFCCRMPFRTLRQAPRPSAEASV